MSFRCIFPGILSSGAGGGPWDISTASFVQSFDLSSQDGAPYGLFMRPDGSKMYVMGGTSDSVHEYTLSTLWDISSSSFIQSFDVSAQDGNPRGLFFKPDGTKMYSVGLTGDDVHEYSLSTPWNISTASFSQSFSVTTQDTSPSGLFFKPDGTKMYVGAEQSDKILEYNLSTAWDISTAVFLQDFSSFPDIQNPSGLHFKPDGTRMFVSGLSDPEILEYSLGTPWSVSTASFVREFSTSAQESRTSAMFFKPDGTKMYAVGWGNDSAHEYNLG